MKLSNTIRQLTKEIDRADMPNIIKGKNQRYVFPFVISLGTINNSELGEVKGNIKPSNFNQYSRIWTGKDNVILTWKGSTSCVKPTDDADHLVKEFTEGVGIKLYLDEIVAGVETLPAAQDADFASQQAIIQITAISEGQVFDYDSLFDMYYIPTTKTKAIFEISQLITYLDKEDKSVLGQEITFSSVNDKMAASGQAIDQYFQWGAPGEGYAWPKEDVLNKTFSLDQDKLNSYGITDIQLEIFGGGILSGITIMGRRVDNPKDLNINAPKLLFPYKINVPTPSEVSKTAGGENNFYFIANGNVETIAYYKNWKDNFKDNYDFTAKRTYEGVIDTNSDTVKATNNQTPKIDIYDSTWNIPTAGTKIDASAIALFEDNEVSLPDTMKVPELLMVSTLAFFDTQKLPISSKETTIWNSTDIPIIGGFLNRLSLGIPWGGQTTTAKIAAKPIMGFIPATLYDFSETSLSADGAADGKLPIDMFRNDTPDQVAGALGSNSISTIINFAITDKVNQGGTIYDTKDLGQKTENGGWKFTSPLEARLVDPDLDTEAGFIIDYLGWTGMAKCDYKFTAYRYGSPLFQIKKQSRAKFTGAIREWLNGNKMSNWNEKNNVDIDYPEAIIPKPPVSGYDNIIIDWDKLVKGSDPYTPDDNYPTKEGKLVELEFGTTQTLTIDMSLPEYGSSATWEDIKIKYNKMEVSLKELLFKNTLNGTAGYVEYYNYEADKVLKTIPLSLLDTEGVEQEILTNSKDVSEHVIFTFGAGGGYIGKWDYDIPGKIEYIVSVKREGVIITVNVKVGNPKVYAKGIELSTDRLTIINQLKTDKVKFIAA